MLNANIEFTRYIMSNARASASTAVLLRFMSKCPQIMGMRKPICIYTDGLFLYTTLTASIRRCVFLQELWTLTHDRHTIDGAHQHQKIVTHTTKNTHSQFPIGTGASEWGSPECVG